MKQAISDALATLEGNGVISVIEKKWLGSALDLSSIPLTAGAEAPSSNKTNGTTTNASTGQTGSNAVQPPNASA